MLVSIVRILIVNVHLKIGGVERQLIYLLQGLDRKKFKLFLALCEGVGELLKAVPGDVEVFSCGSSYRRYKIPLFSTWLSKVIKKCQPDIIFSLHGKTNSAAVIASIMNKRRTVVTSLPGYIKRGKLYCLHSMILNQSKVIVCVSEGVATAFLKGYLVKRPVRVIPNCVDIDKVISLAREDTNHPWLKQPREVPVIISVGRLEKGKGFEDIIKAINLTHDKMKIRLLIVGDGSYKNYLMQIVRQYSLHEFVDFIGLQYNPYKFMSRADLFVLASVSEGLPVSLLESMTLGIPIITANYMGDPSGVIEHMKNGIIVAPRNPKMLSDAICSLLRNKKMCSKFILSGKKIVYKNFTIKKCIKNYEKLFLSLSEQKK